MYALYNFEAELDVEIDIISGETLILIEADETYSGWTKVQNSRGEIGIVPTTYISTDAANPVGFNTVDLVDSDEEKLDSVEDLPKNVNKPRSNSAGTIQRSNSLAGLNSSLLKRPCKNMTGIENFLLDEITNSETFQSQIIIDESGKSVWKPRSIPYRVYITGYQTDKKYGGFKNFVTYEIQTERLEKIVRRRYNHFAWLHSRLEEHYPNICVPPLPEKAMTGNFETDFIKKRKAHLELWLNRLSSHPVIGECESLIHFLQSDDSKWKTGKRKAEKDDLTGAQWMATVQAPDHGIGNFATTKEFIDKFTKATTNLDNRVKEISAGLEKVSNSQKGSFKKEFGNLGKRFEEYGLALCEDTLDSQNNSLVSNAFVTTGNAYTQIGNMYAEQPPEDIYPLLDRLNLYRKVLHKIPSIAQFEKNSVQVFEEIQLKPEKLQGSNLQEIVFRKDLITHVTFAELNLINQQKSDEMTEYMKAFLGSQIQFYAQMQECLTRALDSFKDIPVEKKIDGI